MEQVYPNDQSDVQWKRLEEFDPVKHCGRGLAPHDLRQVLNAIP